MAINDNGTRDQYVATASQTIFPYTFEIFDQADVAVEQNGTLLSIGTHYAVSGVNVDSGGNITLVTGATAGDILTIYRDMALSRVTDYQNNGAFLADDIDSDFDRLWAALQQNKNGSDLSIRANIDDAVFNSTNTTLTTPALRANKALAFTSTGELDYIAGTMPVGTLRNYTTITAMIADVANISIGDISLLDERTSGNGGGAKWKAIDATTSPGNAPNTRNIVAGNAAIAFQLITDGWVNIKQLGTVGNGEDSTAVEQFAAANYQYIVVPYGTYLRTGKVSIAANQTWYIDNAEYTQDGVNFTTVFEADDIQGWHIAGRTRCKGSLVTGADVGAEIGLLIKGCSRYTVDNFHATNMRDHGIRIVAGLLAPAPRGDQGQFNNCSANENRVGITVDPDTSTEFNVFNNFNACGNLNGVVIGAGNCLFMGGNIVDNSLGGVDLIAGSNHAHGSFIGTQINHNAGYNIQAINVTFGHTFNGCHLYGNGGITCPIILTNSQGISITDGIVDCAIYNDGTTGQNTISNNFIASAVPTINGTNPEMLRLLDNWNEDGKWVNDDPSSDYATISRASTALAVSNGTVLVFNNAEKDKRTDYNTTTGVYTAPVAGTYTINGTVTITATGLLAANTGYLELRKNTTALGFIPVPAVSDTVAVASFSIDLILAAGDLVDLMSRLTGTSPLLGITTSRVSFRLA